MAVEKAPVWTFPTNPKRLGRWYGKGLADRSPVGSSVSLRSLAVITAPSLCRSRAAYTAHTAHRPPPMIANWLKRSSALVTTLDPAARMMLSCPFIRPCLLSLAWLV